MKKVETEKAPAAIGPYVQANVYNGIIYTSGQIAMSPETGEVVGTDIATQTKQVLTNLYHVLAEAGGDFSTVIKTTCFISDMNHFTAFNQVYEEMFGKNFPARSCVEVSRLPKDVLIEVEAIAVSK